MGVLSAEKEAEESPGKAGVELVFHPQQQAVAPGDQVVLDEDVVSGDLHSADD